MFCVVTGVKDARYVTGLLDGEMTFGADSAQTRYE